MNPHQTNSVEETAENVLNRFMKCGARVGADDWQFLKAELTTLVEQARWEGREEAVEYIKEMKDHYLPDGTWDLESWLKTGDSGGDEFDSEMFNLACEKALAARTISSDSKNV